MKREVILFIPFLFLSLALTSCTSELGDVLDAIEKGLGRTEKVEESKTTIPKDYYTRGKLRNRPNTYSNLKKFLKSRVGLSEYNTGEYDCSEMAAFLEYRLEDAGFNAYIAEGPAPSDKTKRHAWVFVRTWRYGEFQWIPIEPTDSRFYNIDEGVTVGKIFSRLFEVPGIVTSSNSPYYYHYFKYDKIYNSIHDVPKSKLNEYDWWKSFY